MISVGDRWAGLHYQWPENDTQGIKPVSAPDAKSMYQICIKRRFSVSAQVGIQLAEVQNETQGIKAVSTQRETTDVNSLLPQLKDNKNKMMAPSL